MEEYGFKVNSNNGKAKPIALIKNTNGDMIDLVPGKKKDKINVEKNELMPIFNTSPEMNVRIYIAGQSGCGKSYFTSQVMVMMHKIYKKRIILFSTIEFDPSYDKNKKLEGVFTRYLLNDENVEELGEITEEDLKDTLVVFDDFMIFKPKLRQIVNSLKDIILKRGRHYNIDSVIINDKICDNANSKTELNQSNYVVIFPKCTNQRQLTNYLNNYLGLEKDISQKLKELPSRWICISKLYPRYVVHQHGVFML